MSAPGRMMARPALAVVTAGPSLAGGGDVSAVQVMIDGQGVEVAAVVPWAAWLALADVARGLVPHLFDDLAGGVEGGDGSGFGSVGGDGSGDDVGRSGNAGHIGAIRR